MFQSRKKNWLFFVITLGFSILVCESLLSVAAYFFPFVKYHLSPPWDRNVIPDPILGKRMSPYYPGHDRRGYRNTHIPETCELLAIGDSMTYGHAAPPEGSWPRQLERLSGKATYNASVGGYGPCEYEGVLDELLLMKPKIVLVGLCLENDIIGAYWTVYIDGRFKHLKSSNEVVLNDIKRLDEEATFLDLAKRYRVAPTGQTWQQTDTVSPLWEWIRRHSSLYKLGRSTLYSLRSLTKLFHESLDDTFEVAAKKTFRLTFDAVPRFRTVFIHPSIMELGINLNDQRIREGLRITQSVILSMNDKMKKHGGRLIIVLISGKSSVYQEIVQKYDNFPREYFDVVKLEETLTKNIVKFLEENTISYVETLQFLRSQFSQELPYYSESDDHHPKSAGYFAIAKSILPFLEN
jgi:hypothetical protein